jgi:hypothetical protein
MEIQPNCRYPGYYEIKTVDLQGGAGIGGGITKRNQPQQVLPQLKNSLISGNGQFSVSRKDAKISSRQGGTKSC